MITNKDFPYFVALMDRVKAQYPHIHGDVIAIAAEWQMNGCIDIQVTLKQDAPTQKLRDFDPGKYTVHLNYEPYFGGPWGPAAWEIKDYQSFKGSIPVDPQNDAYLKPNQTPYTRGFGEEWRSRLIAKDGKFFKEVWVTGYPNCKEWDGKRLLAGADYRVVIAD